MCRRPLNYKGACPIDLVCETAFEKDGVTPKKLNTNRPLGYRFREAMRRAEPDLVVERTNRVAWPAMDKCLATSGKLSRIGQTSLKVCLQVAMALSKRPGCEGLWDPLRKYFKSMVGNREDDRLRYRPQPIPRLITAKSPNFVEGKWYFLKCKSRRRSQTTGRYVVVQVLRRTWRPRHVGNVTLKGIGKACLELRQLEERTVRGITHVGIGLDELQDTRAPRQDGVQCACCGKLEPHEAVVTIDGQTLCAFQSIRRGDLHIVHE